jgi:hypothetical protein
MRSASLVLLAFLCVGVGAALAGSRPIQHGTAQGVRVDVYSSGVAVFDLRRVAPTPRRLLHGPDGITYGCFHARFTHGIWHTAEYALDGHRFSRRLVFRWNHLTAPYDGCELGGLYGHRWNDAFGTRNAVEIWLTPLGRHFFNDRAAARDLAYFVRSRRIQQQLRLAANPQVGLAWFVNRYPGRVVEMAKPSGRVAKDVIGVWIGPQTITFTATSSTHRRFFVVAKRGTYKLPLKNLGDLAFAF